MATFADKLTTWAIRLLEPVQTRLRRSRLDAHETPLIEAMIRPRINCKKDECSDYVVRLIDYSQKFKTNKSKSNYIRDNYSSTPSIIDLEYFGLFQKYVAMVSKSSKGNDNRAAKKASRLGYQTRRISANSYRKSISNIYESKRFRSGGPVFAAFFKQNDRISDRIYPADIPSCSEHWKIEFAVFGTKGPNIAAHAALIRCGTLVRTGAIMAHADALKDGVMKLLMFDMIEWLMSDDPCVKGVKYLQYGAVEHGVEGLFDWKCRLQFQGARFLIRDE